MWRRFLSINYGKAIRRGIVIALKGNRVEDIYIYVVLSFKAITKVREMVVGVDKVLNVRSAWLEAP